MTLQLYTAPGTIGVASHIALEESGLAYQTIKIDFAMKEQLSEHYRKINPNMRVPALIVDGQVLTETPAILVYVAQIASSSVMELPTDPLAFAHIQSFNSYLASTVHIAHAHKMRGARWTDDADALCQWLEGDGVDISRYPAVRAHHSRMLKRESVRRVLSAY